MSVPFGKVVIHGCRWIERPARSRGACGNCARDLPVAPGARQLIIAHVGAVTCVGIIPCPGDDATMTSRDRAALEHPAHALARQYRVLDDDSLWEGL